MNTVQCKVYNVHGVHCILYNVHIVYGIQCTMQSVQRTRSTLYILNCILYNVHIVYDVQWTRHLPHVVIANHDINGALRRGCNPCLDRVVSSAESPKRDGAVGVSTACQSIAVATATCVALYTDTRALCYGYGLPSATVVVCWLVSRDTINKRL